MITLSGILRQKGEVTIKEKPTLKIVVEHETARQSGEPDLHLETLFLDRQEARHAPKVGEEVHVEVRPYPSGRGIAFAATRILVAGLADAVPVTA